MKQISVLLGIIGMCFASFFALDARHAGSEVEHQVERLSIRLDKKIIADKIVVYQQRVWSIEDRYTNRDMPTETVDQIRWLKEEIKKLEAELKGVE